jgi:hypothetical protein
MHALLLATVLQRWLVVNDIHLDPFSRAGIVYGSDTTTDLWKSAVRAMQANVPNPRVILLGGDMLAHHFPTLTRDAGAAPLASALAATREIAGDLDTAFPSAQFLVALGNNDDPCGDYRSETAGSYETQLAHIWAPLVDRNGAAPGFIADFERGGYYVARLPIRNGRAIVLNSVFWSFVYSGGCLSHPRDPGRAELAWLDAELARLPADAHTVMLMHVPPGYDPESTTIVRRFLAVPFLSARNDRALLRTLDAHARAVRFVVGAHTHRYDFRIVDGIPMLIASAISPVYRNNPAFFELDVDTDGVLHDVIPYVYDPDTRRWERKPSFDAMYRVPSFTTPMLETIAARIQNDTNVRLTWIAAYDLWSHHVHDITTRNWLPFACAQTQLEDGYAACAGTQTRSRTLELTGIALMLALVAFVYAALRRKLRRR